MQIKLSAATAALLPALAAADPTPSCQNICCPKPPAFFLAGDSTTAIQSEGGGGWGNGFLTFLQRRAWGVNFGHNGATTKSFVSGGDWANVTQHVRDNRHKFDVYVTIQFGHNDQKPKANISLEQYQANLESLAREIQDLGATPILVTPLARRNFESEHNATDSLHNERLYTIVAAAETGSLYLDLNKESMWYVNTIGEKPSHVYNLHPDDNTHLNDYGGVVFGRMVADLLLNKRKCLESWVQSNKTMSHDIWAGLPA